MVWHYYQVGKGDKLTLFFPGYGHACSRFLPLFDALSRDYTCVCIELPRPSTTLSDIPIGIRPEAIKALVCFVLRQYQRTAVTLMGYSLGGRYALTAIAHCPELIEALVLLAPDGLTSHPAYIIATQTVIGRWLFRVLMNHPAALQAWFHFLRKTDLIDRERYLALIRPLSTPTHRHRLADSWLQSRFLGHKPNAIKRLVQAYQIRFLVLCGSTDALISARQCARYVQHIPGAECSIVHAGHWLLTPEIIQRVSRFLSRKK